MHLLGVLYQKMSLSHNATDKDNDVVAYNPNDEPHPRRNEQIRNMKEALRDLSDRIKALRARANVLEHIVGLSTQDSIYIIDCWRQMGLCYEEIRNLETQHAELTEKILEEKRQLMLAMSN